MFSHHPKRARQASGFTIIELIVTVAIAAILAAIALPSFRDTIMRNRIVTSAASFQADIAYARSEAVRRGVTVALCPANVLTGTPPFSCLSGSDWSNGWLVYVDANASNTLDTGDATLRERLPEKNLSIVGISGTMSTATQLQARPSGELLQDGAVRVCNSGYIGQDVTVQRSGNIRASATPAKCS